MKSINKDSFAAAFQLVVLLYLFFYPTLPNKKLPVPATNKTTLIQKTAVLNSPTQNFSKRAFEQHSGINRSELLTSIEGIPNIMFSK